MTRERDFKRLVRMRMGRTGESYAAARARLRRHAPPPPTVVRGGSGMYQFDRFDEAAKRTLERAQSEAERCRHSYIGTEHLLLAMVRGPGVAGQALARLGMTPEAVEDRLEAMLSRVPSAPGDVQSPVPTARARKAIELAYRAAEEAGQRHIGTHHLLLGLLAEGQGVAVHVLGDAGAGPDAVRGAVLAVLAAGGEVPPGPRPAPSEGLRRALFDAESVAAIEGAAAVESEHVRLAMGDSPVMALARSGQDLRARRLEALEEADHEAAARLRAEETALRERLVAALAEWRRNGG
ncbi:MAG TPA: Clp protease N-terminal domain-containing protein [Candidatus Dormibacteraeota bacterium]